MPPKYALVCWPDNRFGAPSCIYLSGVEDALKRGAYVVAIEDDELCGVPVERPQAQADGDGGDAA